MPDKQSVAYFDYAASTPVHPAVAQQLYEDIQSDTMFANSAATHPLGVLNKQHLAEARQQFADVIAADAREIVFTSGATESNNLALKGALTHHQAKNPRVITLQSEHKAVLDPIAILAKSGVKSEFLPVSAEGLLDLAQLEKALQTPTTLVSVMAVNNETGVVQPITQIADMVHHYGAKLHVDAAQALGKIAVDVNAWQADMVSFSGHKIYAPQGIGALFVKRLPKMRLQAQLHGGGQERGRRSGTSPLALVRALALAARLADERRQANVAVVNKRYHQLCAGLPTHMTRNGNGDSVPHIVNLDTQQNAATVLAAAGASHIALSSGSACSAANAAGSHVLQAMGLHAAATRSIRVSLSHLTTAAEIAKLIAFLQACK